MHKNNQHNKEYYYMYGKHAVKAAMNNPKRRILQIFCTQEIWNEEHKLISRHPHQIVTVDFLTKSLQKQKDPLKKHQQTNTHQGIVAKVHTIFNYNIHTIDLQPSNCKIAILDQITDPQNVGTIIRSAAALNISAIIMPQDNTPNENATIAKAACGTLEFINIIKVVNIRTTIKYLKKQGFWLIGLDGNAEDDIKPELMRGKIAIALGSEEKGLRKLTKEHCDHLVKIPMLAKVESLNVASAATIAFYLASLNKT